MNDVERGDALVAAGRPDEGVAMVRAAAERGDAGALMRLATWHMIGSPLERDLRVAREWLRRAVAAGHVDAALMEAALTANGSGAKADWAGALRLLRTAAADDPVAREHLQIVEAMRLDPHGAPAVAPRGRLIGEKPDVWLFEKFLTPGECVHLAREAEPVLDPALVTDPGSGRMVPHPIRTSHAAVIGPTRETLVIRAINRRVAAASGTDVARGEPLVVLRYAPGQQYRPHMDTLPRTANQRSHTMLMYLNAGYGGGETQFPANGVTVRARAGDAILFWNTGEGGAPDPLSKHAGLPVTAGVKWLATRWIRAAPHDPWTARD